MPKEKQLVPKLRFPGFDGNWKQTTLGKESVFLDSQRRPIKEGDRNLRKGQFPYYGASGIIDYIDNYIFEGENVLLGEDGANILNRNSPLAFVVNGKYWVNNHAHVIKAKGSNTFLAECLERIRYDKYNTGTAQPKLNAEVCKNISIIIPLLPEQQKIAQFLTAIDNRIQNLEKKKTLLEQYKKGVMQKIFKRELRFKNDDGNEFDKWKNFKLSDVASRVTTKNKIDNQNVLTISAQLGLVSQSEYFNKSVSAKNLTGYFLLKRNDFAYNKSYSNGYPMGAIKRLDKYELGVVSTLYICFRFNEKVSLDFMEQYFDSGLQNKEIEKVAQEGARNHGLLNIGVNDFFEINLKIPSLPEQTKIANFLTTIDKKIDLTHQQIEHTKTYKKGLLQQMFV